MPIEVNEHSYQPHERLRTKAEYERVLTRKCCARGKHLIVYGCENEVSHPRLGRVVGKRWGNAVARNRYRRWLREAFRRTKSAMPAIDIVVMIVQKHGMNYATIETELASLARQAQQKLRLKPTH